jgi:mannose-6-phosphate isomerase-like protein (cupin superfamily)
MKKQKCLHLLSKNDIEDIFKDAKLYENKSFFVIDSITKEYDTNISFDSLSEYSKRIRESFKRGCTIIVKNLEMYNQEIRSHCAKIGKNVDVHMYLVPPNGKQSFNFHQDDREVKVHIVYGSKTFILKNNDKEKSYLLESGQFLDIPKGTIHKAIPNGSSCLLSFGFEKEVSYQVPFGITKEDLTSP